MSPEHAKDDGPLTPCRVCDTLLPPKRFYRRTDAPTGRDATCKFCRGEQIRRRQGSTRRVRKIVRPGWARCPGCPAGRNVHRLHRFGRRSDGGPKAFCYACAAHKAKTYTCRRALAEPAWYDARIAAVKERRAAQRAVRLAHTAALTAQLDGWRRARGLSKAATARLLGVGVQQIFDWVAGRCLPTRRNAAKLRALLEG